MEPRLGAPLCAHCGWDPTAPPRSSLQLAPGTVLQGAYLVGRVLAEGGLAITYLGWDLPLRRKIAIKEYFPRSIAARQPGTATVAPSAASWRDDYDFGLGHFLDEGKVLARFADHPCVVSVTNLFGENGTGYLVMAYLEGITLAQFQAASGGRLPYPTAREIMMRVMDGLREIHSQGWLHRDIHPDNIFLTRQGPVKILNFGAARMADGERGEKEVIAPQEGYAPEEQYRSNGKEGPWTDVYGCAATLYRLITGITPPPVLDRLASDTLQRPSALGAAIPPDAEAALLRALAVSAGARFQSIEAFQTALGVPIHEPAPEAYRLFDTASVTLATFLGSPFAGTVLMAHNYRRLGKRGHAIAALAAGLAATVGSGLLTNVLPPAVVFVLGIVMLVILSVVARQIQGPAVAEHVRQGSRRGSRWAAAGIGLAVLAAYLGVIYAIPLLKSDPKIVVGTNDEVYYTGSATKENAEALGGALKTTGYFADRHESVALSKGADGTTVTFITKEAVWERPEAIDTLEEVGREIAPSIGGFPLRLRLANAARQTQKELVVGRVIVGTNDEMYYLGAATESDARAIGQALRTIGYFRDLHWTAMVSKGNGATRLSFIVGEGNWTPTHLAAFEELVRRIAPSAGGLPIDLRLLDQHTELKNQTMVF
jgi:serine/threonine protein kinase